MCTLGSAHDHSLHCFEGEAHVTFEYIYFKSGSPVVFESSLWDTFSCLFKKRIGLQSFDVFALSLL